MKNFCKIMEQSTPDEKTFIKIYRILRIRIKIHYHNLWSHNYLGEEHSDDGKSRVEIDETELIGNSEKVLWIFGIIDRSNKEARVFSFMDNRTKEHIIPIILKNVITQKENINRLDLRTRAFSDCFYIYQEKYFERFGYLLHKVNHSI